MTDKPIIIDGERMFKCVWCKYDFKDSDANFILSENPNECVCSGCMTEWADNLLWDFKRKEQECFELQMTANAYNPLVKIANYRLDKIEDLQEQLDQLKAENEKLKQTLAEIKELCKRQDLNQGSRCIQILQKISEVQK